MKILIQTRFSYIVVFQVISTKLDTERSYKQTFIAKQMTISDSRFKLRDEK